MEIKEFKTFEEQVAKLIEHGCEDITSKEYAITILKRINYIRTMNQEDKTIVLEDIDKAIEEVIPIATSSKEKIAVLEQYCKDRARKVAEDEVKENKRKASVLDLDL